MARLCLAALLVLAVSPRDSRQDSAGVATVLAGPRQAATVSMLEPGMHVCVCVYARARATETGNAVWVDATETATERSVFKNGNNANVKTFTHGNCVGALCAGWRLFGACAPGKEMAGTSAVCVFEWPYVRMLSGSLTRARAREPRQRTAAQWGRHLPSSSRSWRPCTLRAGPCAPPSPPPSALHGALPVPEGHQLIARRTGGCDREAGAGTWCRQVAGGELCRGVAEQ